MTRPRTIHHVGDPPATSESQATAAFVLLALAAAVIFMAPHYFTFQVGPLPAVVLGDWSTPVLTDSEPWQVGDYAELRHLRLVNGSTCTQVIAGPFTMQACR